GCRGGGAVHLVAGRRGGEHGPRRAGQVDVFTHRQRRRRGEAHGITRSGARGIGAGRDRGSTRLGLTRGSGDGVGVAGRGVHVLRRAHVQRVGPGGRIGGFVVG